MKKYTQKTIELFFKLKKEEYVTLALQKKSKIIIYNNFKNISKGKYSYEILKEGTSKPLKEGFSSNYSEFVEEIHTYLKTKGLIPKDLGSGIVIESSKNTLDLTGNTLDSFFNNNDEKDLNLNKLNEKDLDDNIFKISVKNNSKMIIEGELKREERKMNRNDIIKILVDYIDKLVKKRSKDFNINHIIEVITSDGKLQKLNIVEETGGNEENAIELGFVDSNLVNSVFMLCSLSDLTIDKMKLKIWLNKIIIKDKLFLIKLEK